MKKVSFVQKVCIAYTFESPYDRCKENEKGSSIICTLESGKDVGQGINVGPENFGKNNKRKAVNKCRAN